MELQKLIDGLKAHKNGAASYESVDEAIRVFETMRDVDGEKVCKGLECCILRDPDDHRRCGECPYNPHSISNEPCTNGLMANALALIRQQQERIAELEAAQLARVMTLKEIENMTPDPDTDDNFCWIEYRDGTTRLIHVNLVDSLCPVAEYPNGHKSLVYQCSGSSGHANYLHDQVYYIRTWYVHHGDFDTYNLTWRCWTQRPTDEQRKAAKWE